MALPPMTRKQQCRTAMFETVIAFLASNAAILATKKALSDAIVAFKEAVGLVHANAAAQSAPVKSASADKAQARGELEEKVLEINDQIAAFADVTNNPGLAEQVRLTAALLEHCSDEDMEAVTTRISALAAATMAEMKDYELDQSDLTELDTLAARFKAAKPATRGAVNQRHVAGSSLDGAIRTADRVLRNRVDKLMRPLRATNPEIATGYYSARIIVDRGSRSAEPEAPVAAATLAAVPTPAK
jgi:hypothetical protein